MGIKFSNKASTSLTSGISTSDTTINVADGSVFPTLGANDFFYATLMFLNDSSETEVIKVTAVNTNQLTVDRSIETSKSFSTNDVIELRVTAQALADPTLLADGMMLEDGRILGFGTSEDRGGGDFHHDLEIRHDGANSYIKDWGTGNLAIEATELALRDNTGNRKVFCEDGNDKGVSVHFGNEGVKLATTTDGITVTGDVTADGLTLGDNEAATFNGNLEIKSNGTESSITETGEGALTIKGGNFVVKNSSNQNLIVGATSLQLYNDGERRMQTVPAGIAVEGNNSYGGQLTLREANYANAGEHKVTFKPASNNWAGNYDINVPVTGDGSMVVADSSGNVNVNGTVTADGLTIDGDSVINGEVDIQNGHKLSFFQGDNATDGLQIFVDAAGHSHIAEANTTEGKHLYITGDRILLQESSSSTDKRINIGDNNGVKIYGDNKLRIVTGNGTYHGASLADSIFFYTGDGDAVDHKTMSVSPTGIDVVGTVTSDKLKVDTTTDIKALQIISSHNGAGATPDVSIERSEIHVGTTNGYHSVGNLNFVGKNATFDGTNYSTGLSSVEYGRIGVVANSHLTGSETGRISFNVYDHAVNGLISPLDIFHNKVKASKDLEVIGTVTAENSIEITSSDAGATASPVLALYKDNSNPTVNDIVGAVRFFGNNTGADNKKLMGGIECTYTGSTTTGNSAFEETAKLSFHLPRGDGYIDFTASDNPVTSITGDITGDHVFMELDEQYLSINTEKGLKFNPATTDGIYMTLPADGGGVLTIENHNTQAGSVNLPDRSGTIIVGERDSNGNLRLNESFVRDVELAPRTEVISTSYANASALLMVKNRKYVNTYNISSNTFILPTGTNTGQMLTVVNASDKDLYIDRTTNSITIKKLVAESDPTSITTGNLTVKKGGVVEFVYSGNTEVQCFGSGI